MSTCVVTLTAKDVTAPVITVCPGDLTVTLATPGSSFAVPDLVTGTTATDNCTVTVTQSPVSGTMLTGVGTYPIVMTATDGGGNTVSCTVLITATFTPQGLQVTCPGAITETMSDCQANGKVVNYTVQTNQNYTIDYNGNPPGSTFVLGTTTVLVEVEDGQGNSGSCSFTVTVEGPEGITALGNGHVIVNGDNTPSSTDLTKFTSVGINGTSTRVYTIRNTGMSSQQITGVTVTGPAGRFAVIGFSPITLSACGGSTTVTVRYTGSGSAGTHTGTIEINSTVGTYSYAISGATSTKLMQVRGNAVPIPDGDVTPQLSDWTDFGVVNYNTTRTRSFYVHNLGTQTLNLAGNPRVTLSGAGASRYTVTLQPASTVVSNGSRQFSIRFSGTGTPAGVYTATVSIASDDLGANPYTFTISAQVLNPNMSVTGNNQTIVSGDATPRTQDNTDFGVRNVNSSTTLSYYVRNATGSGVLALTGSPRAVITGPGAAAFRVATQPGATVNAGGSSLLRITYNPRAVGTYEATVSIMNNDTVAVKQPYTFAIRGTTPGAPSLPYGGDDWVIEGYETEEEELTSWPNPVNAQLYIEAPYMETRYRVEIINTEGRVLYHTDTEGGRLEVHTTGWQPGMYLIRAIGVDMPPLRFVKM